MSIHHSTGSNNVPEISRRDFLRFGTAGAIAFDSFGPAQSAQAARATAPCESVVLLWMQGGVSHLDTLDPKPDAPAAIRGPFRAIGTNVPGIQLCEHLPLMARVADKIAFIRSMHHDEGAHDRGIRQMLTACHPLPGTRQPNSRGSAPASASIVDDEHFQSGSHAAFNLDAEPANIRDAYGRTSLGRKCLLARRLVEAGSRFVTVNENGWDHHFRAFDALKNRLPAFDRSVSALLGDLADRGLLDRTLVVFATEFGRSPRINNEAGREHHPGVFSCFLAGGGIKGGCVVGDSDSRGESPSSRPVTPADLFQTLRVQLGMEANDHRKAVSREQLPAALRGGSVIRELV